MATGYALLKNRTDDNSVYQVPAAPRRHRPTTGTRRVRMVRVKQTLSGNV